MINLLYRFGCWIKTCYDLVLKNKLYISAKQRSQDTQAITTAMNFLKLHRDHYEFLTQHFHWPKTKYNNWCYNHFDLVAKDNFNRA